MKKEIKILTLSAFTLLIFFTSCTREKLPDKRNIFIGYIYNSIDSTPFQDTEFKVYFYNKNPLTGEVTLDEDFFYTDENGYFNHTTDMVQGVLAWPSYFEGAFNGPPHFGAPNRFTEDEENRVYTHYYDTIYTTPYY